MKCWLNTESSPLPMSAMWFNLYGRVDWSHETFGTSRVFSLKLLPGQDSRRLILERTPKNVWTDITFHAPNTDIPVIYFMRTTTLIHSRFRQPVLCWPCRLHVKRVWCADASRTIRDMAGSCRYAESPSWHDTFIIATIKQKFELPPKLSKLYFEPELYCPAMFLIA